MKTPQPAGEDVTITIPAHMREIVIEALHMRYKRVDEALALPFVSDVPGGVAYLRQLKDDIRVISNALRKPLTRPGSDFLSTGAEFTGI